jgi:hypothetical protein
LKDISREGFVFTSLTFINFPCLRDALHESFVFTTSTTAGAPEEQQIGMQRWLPKRKDPHDEQNHPHHLYMCVCEPSEQM